MESANSNNEKVVESVYPAALGVTAPLLPSVAMVVTIIVYLVPNGARKNIEVSWVDLFGDFAVLVGIIASVLVWLAVAYFYRPYTAAAYVSPRTYNTLKERLDHLKIRVAAASDRRFLENSVLGAMRSQALGRASRECVEIEKGLASKGMPWVTGLGYIELWRRVHRAEEALIKVEPSPEKLEGAMRDESRLINATMENKELLRHRLKKAVAILGNSDPDTGLSILTDPAESSEYEVTLVASEEHAKALIMMSEVRYEINNFRDSVWEGIVHARNRLRHTSVVLGFAAYALLGLAIFAKAPNVLIIWVVTYFLIGALAGLFARAQAEWSADTAVDDFGLSKARLLQVAWLSGLAAVGGVLLVTPLVGSESVSSIAGFSAYRGTFDVRPAFFIVAAVAGLMPDLILRRLTQQADKYKEDLQSTTLSQSTDATAPSGTRIRSEHHNREYLGATGKAVVLVYLTITLGLSLALILAVWPTAPEDRGFLSAISVEFRYLLLVASGGALGGSLQDLTSLINIAGKRRIPISWLWRYLFRVLITVPLALTLYVVIRGGILRPNAGTASLNPFGVLSVSVLVGMLATPIIGRLSALSEVLSRQEPELERQIDRIGTALGVTTLDNYSGFVCLFFQEEGGEAVDIADNDNPILRSTQRHKLVVLFQPDKPERGIAEEIRIEDGSDTDNVEFHLVPDSDSISLQPRQQSVSFGPMEPSPPLDFQFSAPEAYGPREFWVEVSQKNRLVHVISATCFVQ